MTASRHVARVNDAYGSGYEAVHIPDRYKMADRVRGNHSRGIGPSACGGEI